MSWIPGITAAGAAISSVNEDEENKKDGEKPNKEAQRKKLLFYTISSILGLITLFTVIILISVF
ncbi:MAG TPA: hypothetical protein VMZ29_12970 [Candidatus Bathyarchaeia archaeon]|nr:hypothetical protein [Candidatus Bathyarchaeia archaeon]